jgi:HAMP domain-containing protein
MSFVTDTTLIIIGVVIGVLCLLIALTSFYLTAPLSKIMDISHQIIAAIGTEDAKRDYTSAVTDAFFVQNARGDEIGALTSEFFVVVTMLHNKNVEKKRQPKYPANPFHLRDYWQEKNENAGKESNSTHTSSQMLNWQSFMDTLASVGLAPSVALTAEPAVADRYYDDPSRFVSLMS